MYIPTKFHGFISFGFLVMLVEEEQGDDEQKYIIPIIAPYIYGARYHAHPYILSTTVLSHGHICGGKNRLYRNYLRKAIGTMHYISMLLCSVHFYSPNLLTLVTCIKTTV